MNCSVLFFVLANFLHNLVIIVEEQMSIMGDDMVGLNVNCHQFKI